MVQISRRGAILGGLAAIGTAGTLSACSGSGDSQDAQAANDAVKLPTFTAYKGVTPDWPGDEILLSGFKAYPADPVAGIKQPPGDGKPISFVTNIPGAIPPQLKDNPFWQSINDKLGSELTIEMAPNADYATKFQTMIASGKLPDLINIPPGTSDLPGLLTSTCMDLTEHLSGDAVSEYPYLANLGPEYWRGCVADGTIRGVPVPRMISRSFAILTRRDLLQARGIDPDVQPATWDDFIDLCKEMTRPQENVWALTTNPSNIANMAAGIPNAWHRAEDGTFTSFIENEAMPASLEAQIALREAGVLNPDSFNANASTKKEWFSGGTASMDYDSFVAWNQYEAANLGTEGFSVGGFVAPSLDGSKPLQWLGAALNNITGFSADSSHDVKTLLAVANWFAAPFGTAEYLLNKYGVAGQQYELEGTDPIPTSRGVQETGIGLQYICDAPMSFYFPGRPDVPERQYGLQSSMKDRLSKDDSYGLYSPTRDQKAAEIETPVWDAMSEMVQGRRPVSDLSSVVKTWRDAGGAKIAEELATAYEASEVKGG